MRSSISILLSAAVSLASACNQAPSGKNVGNPIHTPGLNQLVPAGLPFTITWQPTSPGPISLVLLRGPSTNVLPIACINESLPNSGTFSWTPPTTLEADVTHYGLQIIDDKTGDYQYSTQFGISNPAYGKSSTSLSSTTSSQTTASASKATTAPTSQAPSGTSSQTTTSATSTSKTAPISQPLVPTLPSTPHSNITFTSTSLPPSALHPYPPTLNTTTTSSYTLPPLISTPYLNTTAPSLHTSTTTAPTQSASGAGSVTVSVDVSASRTGRVGGSGSGAGATGSGTGTASGSLAVSTGGAGRVGVGIGMGMAAIGWMVVGVL